MKKVYIHKSDVFNTVCIYTVDENLSKKKTKFPPEKLARANEQLRKLKTPLPK